MNTGSQIFLLALGFVIVGVLVFYLLYLYADFKKTAWYVLISTFVGWFISFGIVILVPLDVSSVITSVHHCILTVIVEQLC